MPIAKVQLPDGRIAKMEVPEGTTAQQATDAAMRMFGDPGSITAAPAKWKRDVSDLAHNVLPMAGGGIGGAVGSSTGPAGTVGGGAGGYAIGEQTADVLDEWLGIHPVRDWGESAKNAAGNFYEGLQAEAFGLGLAGVGQGAATLAKRGLATKPGKAVAEGVKSLGREVFPRMSERAAQEEVGRLLVKFQTTGDTQFLRQAQEVADNVPGFKYTTGMGANNRDLLSLERGTINASAGKTGLEGASGQLDDMVRGNVEASQNALHKIKQGTAGDFADEMTRQKAAMEVERQGLSQGNPQRTGERVLTALDDAHTPVKKTLSRLNEAVPDYPVQIENTQNALKSLRGQKDLSKNQHEAVARVGNDIAKQFKQTGQTTRTMIGVQRTVNDAISQASAKGDDSTVAVLMQVKTALKADLDEVAVMARTGRLKEYQGKPVFPDKLAAELEENTLRQMELLEKEKPDIKGMAKALRENKQPAMRIPGETEDAFNQRISAAYEKVTGQKPLIIADQGAQKVVAELERRNASIRKILDEVEPGQDVAALLNARNRYAEEQHFGRFGTESVKVAQAARNMENVAGKFATPTGTDQLVKAIGRDEAKSAMRPYYQEQLSDLLNRNPSDAQMVKWLRDNRRQLSKLGLQDEFTQIVRNQQGYRELEKITGADIESLFSQVLSGQGKSQGSALAPILKRIKGNAKAQQGLKAALIDHLDSKMFRDMAAGKTGFGQVEKQLNQLEPTLQAVFSPAEIKQLGNIREAIKVTQRMTQGTSIGGSHTQELLKASERLAGERKWPSKIADLMINGLAFEGGRRAGGFAGGAAAMTSVGALREQARQHGTEAVRRYFVRATFDPEYAKTLMYMVRPVAPGKAVIDRFNGQLSRLVGRQALSIYSQGQKSPQE